MGTKLTKAPVCFTLAQVRFNPVLTLDRYIPEIQDGLRRAGFPAYSPSTTQAFQIATGPDGKVETSSKSTVRHVFQNKEQTAALLLDQNALTFELSEYPVFEQFVRHFTEALEVVSDCLPIEFYDRVGMRMLDAVQPREGEAIAQYLVPQALGLSSVIDLGLDHRQTLIESIYKSGGRGLVVRAVGVNEGVAIPPDLFPLHVSLNERFLVHKGATYMLDCDSSQEGRESFSIPDVVSRLSELKSALSASFKVLVTPHALKAWE